MGHGRGVLPGREAADGPGRYLGGLYYDGKIARKGRISVPLGQGESVTHTVDGKKLLRGMEGATAP
ncbi:hypothetical protein ACWGPD_21280 [Streptomyces hirsutus]